MVDDAQAAFLASMLGGGSSGADVADLGAFQQSIAANDMYTQMAQPIFQARFDKSTWTPQQSGITNAIQAFTGTLLSQLGKNQQAAQMSAVNSILPQLYADPASVAMPEGLDPLAFGQLKSKIIARQAEKKAQVADTLKAGLMQSLFTSRPDLAAKALGVPNSATEPVPTSRITDGGPEFGTENLEDMQRRLYEEKRAQGVPAATAEVSAREQVDSLRKRGKQLIGDKLVKEAETISQIEDLVMKGREGIAKAGNTGTFGASTYEKVIAGLSGILPGSQEEALTQSAGDAKLMETRQLTGAINRIVGSGAMSDRESQALFASAMSPDQTVSQNEALLRGYENGLKIMKEHNEFMNYFIDKTGGNPETAQAMWELYKKSNPAVAQDPKTGDYKPNEKRIPWQKFDFTKAYKNYLSGDALMGGGAPMGELQSKVPGQIKSVKRIR
jgi:hypothetical protein